MVNIIRIRNGQDAKFGAARLRRMHKRLPFMVRSVMMRWGKTFERNLKISARLAGIKPFTGELFGKGIEWRQRPRGRIGMLFMRVYGVQLDSMKPHWVNITRTRTRLLAWGLQAKSDAIKFKSRLVSQGIGKVRFPIFVRPHPFIRPAWIRTRPLLNTMLRQGVHVGMKAT